MGWKDTGIQRETMSRGLYSSRQRIGPAVACGRPTNQRKRYLTLMIGYYFLPGWLAVTYPLGPTNCRPPKIPKDTDADHAVGLLGLRKRINKYFKEKDASCSDLRAGLQLGYYCNICISVSPRFGLPSLTSKQHEHETGYSRGNH